MTINPATLTVAGVIAENKQYDATTTAAVNTTGATLNGVLNGDQVTLNATNVIGEVQQPERRHECPGHRDRPVAGGHGARRITSSSSRPA